MEKKLIWKFNIIDLLIIGIIILGIIALVFRTVSGKDNGRIEFMFLCVCEQESRSLLSVIQPGQNCADNSTGADIGTVSEVCPDSVVIRVRGRASEYGISVRNTRYFKGQSVEIITGNILLNTRIAQIYE